MLFSADDGQAANEAVKNSIQEVSRAIDKAARALSGNGRQ